MGGVLGDAFGRRRVLVLGVAVATLANILATFAPSPPWFVITRAAEAFGSALALPMTLAVIRLTFQGRTLPVALLVYTFVTIVAVLTSLVALVLVELAGWRATLVLPIAAGALGTVLAWRYVRDSRASGGGGVRRGVAAAAWSLMLLALTVGLIALRQAGTWPNPITLVAVAIAAGGALALVLNSRNWQAPQLARVDWRQRHAFSVMLLAAAALGLGLSGYLLQLYSFLTVVQGFGTILGALALAPGVLVCLPLARVAARLAQQGDSRKLIAGGLTLMGIAMLLTALLRPGMPYWPLVVPMALFGFSFLLAQTAWTNAFLSALPTELVGVSAGVSKAALMIGTLLGTSLLGSLVLQFGQADFVGRLSSLGLSNEQIALATDAVNVALRNDLPLGSTGTAAIAPTSLVDRGLLAVYYGSLTTGISVALVGAALACLGVAAFAWLVLRGAHGAVP